jgi:hypothetical protein
MQKRKVGEMRFSLANHLQLSQLGRTGMCLNIYVDDLVFDHYSQCDRIPFVGRVIDPKAIDPWRLFPIRMRKMVLRHRDMRHMD